MDLIKEIRTIKDSYYGGTINICEGLDFSQYETLKMVEYYTNSEYLDRDDSSYRPFYNIVNFRVNVATKATDLDTKDIQVYSENPSYQMQSILFNKEIKNWMRKTFFSKSLNELNFTRVKYGGVLAKKVLRDGELYIEVPEWKNLITDTVNIKDGIIIEKHYLTPVEIQAKKGVWNNLTENYDKIIDTLKKKYQNKYTSSSRICVLEVEAQLPKSYITKKDNDEEIYTLQRHFIITDKEENPLVVVDSSEKKSSDYKYLEWLKASGRALGIGVVESGKFAQIETNDAILKNKDLLELASKIWFITDSDIIENNIFSDSENGQIFKIGQQERMQQLNNIPGSLPALMNIVDKWDEQYSRAESTFESITGETMPSGTPFRSVAIQNQESQSTFNYRKEEFGIFINEIFTDWIIPHIKSKINREHLLSSDFDESELKLIDNSFAIYNAIQTAKKLALEGKVVSQEQFDFFVESHIKMFNTNLKNRRYVEIPKDYFKDIEFKLDIITTGEQINKSAVFETLSNIMTTVAGNPTVLQDPNLKKIFSKIIELSGIGITFEEPKNQPQQVEPLIPTQQEDNAGTTKEQQTK